MITAEKKIKEFEICGAIPNERQMEWYKRERSVFFHFGINTFTNREWGDGTDDVKIFDPKKLDCRQWVREISAAGFTTAILTAKHHDGFCLWPSKYTDYSVKNSPYKNGKGDIVREFTDACAEYGVKAGLYLSPWDRHEKTWGTPVYNDYYVNQINEIFANYGKIWECWWDGAGSTVADYDYKRWVEAVRSLQPDAVIFGSLGATPYVDVRWVGNENGIAGKPCWGTVEPIALEKEVNSMLNSGSADGERFIPAEVDVSVRPGWFYHEEQDNQVRSAENLLRVWFSSVGSNAGLLLNVPPDRNGLLHKEDVKNIRKFGRILKTGFGQNLAAGAEIRANPACCAECVPAGLLTDDREKFYMPEAGCMLPEVIFEFEKELSFNTVVLEEVIEFGHKVRGFEVSAKTACGWKTLVSGECIGYRCAEHFDTVSASAVKLKITDAAAVPMLRFFGLYGFNENLFNVEKAKFSNENIMRNGLAFTERNGDCFDINLGGVIPFNKIIFEGDKISRYELYIFDGTKYILYKKDKSNGGKVECNFPEAIDWAYKFRLNITEKKQDIEHLKFEVYYS